MADEKYVSGEEYQAMQSSRQPAPRSSSISLKPVAAVVLILILCGLSFYGGVAYQKGHTKTSPTQTASTTSGNQNGQSGGFGGGFRRGGGFGSVTAISASSISVQNQRSGTTTTYTINSSTTITDNGATVDYTDIKVGDTVVVRPVSSSTTTAATILVNPSFPGASTNPSATGTSQST